MTRRRLLKVAAVAGFALPVGRSQAARVFELDNYQLLPYNLFLPKFGGGYLLNIHEQLTAGPVISRIDRRGRRESFVLALPEGSPRRIQDWAIGSDGTIVVIGSAFNASGKVVMYGARVPLNRSLQVAKVWPHVPQSVALASDGFVWTMAAGNVLRRFDTNLELVSTKTVLTRVCAWHAQTTLAASRDRVGWMTKAGEYIEFSLDGVEAARYPATPEVDSFALSDRGHVVMYGTEDETGGFFYLDRDSKSWVEPEIAGNEDFGLGRVVGFDGELLVTHTLEKVGWWRIE
ncbi:MAG TPA: hypothetical protein VE621_15385 [Bryobacteraceae bacterium]|nr:hypothetical protein [Bryobacteraceae bacterium]